MSRLTEYHFREQWFVGASIEDVWPIIRKVANYPGWWTEFLEATKRNDIDGPGGIVAVHVKAALPYHMHFEIEAVREEPPRIAEVRVRGDLNGSMLWRLVPERGGTRLFFEETVTTGKTVLNVLAPLFKPLFAWNHEIMMKHGEEGLRRLLAGRRPGRIDTRTASG
ncbi:MAG: SRPBCC family protein [bacterium]